MPLTLVAPRKGRSPYYRLRGTVRGVYVDETTGVADRSIAEAIKIQRESRIINESVFGPRVSRTFAEAAVTYVETARPGLTQVLAIIGRQRLDGSTSGCLINDFGPTLVNMINQDAVDQVIRKRYPNAAPATVQRQLLTPLISILSFAAERKWCDRPNFWRPKVPKGRSRWAEYEEAAQLVAAASPHVARLLLFLVLTGARISEALELDWRDVNLEQRWAVFRNTKRNGEDRGVPLHGRMVELLAATPADQRGGNVFLTQKGLPYAEKLDGGGQIKTAWRATVRRAGIVEPIRVHDLRHTFSTWLTMAGVHEQVRDEIMGHASTNMGRRYSHVPRPALLDAVDKLPESFFPV